MPRRNCGKSRFLVGRGDAHAHTHTQHVIFWVVRFFQLIAVKVSPDSNDGYGDHQDDTRGWLYRVVPSG